MCVLRKLLLRLRDKQEGDKEELSYDEPVNVDSAESARWYELLLVADSTEVVSIIVRVTCDSHCGSVVSTATIRRR